MMNPEAQQELERILKLDPISLKPEEIEFLQARRAYLTTEQTRIFGIHFKGLKKTKQIQMDSIPESSLPVGTQLYEGTDTPIEEPQIELPETSTIESPIDSQPNLDPDTQPNDGWQKNK